MKNQEQVSVDDIKKIAQIFSETLDTVKTKEVDFDVTAFSRGYQNAMGAYNPLLQNALMQELSLNPSITNAEKVLEKLQDIKNNESEVISYSQNEYLTNMIYKRNFDYIANLPSFDLSIQCKNAKSEDYNSKAYLRDLAVVEDFLNKFDYRSEFRKAFFNMLNTESYFCMLREDLTPDKYVLQTFPYNYAKITAEFSHGLIADYDMNYFTQPGVDINLYPKWIKKKYNDLFKKNKPYIPSNNLSRRDSQFALWVQTSPEDGAFVFKFNPNFITNVPYFSPMLAETTLMPIYRKLQVNQDIASAKKLITSQWPLLKEQRANIANMLAISPEVMGQLVGACAKALGETFNIVNLPSDKIETNEFTNTNADAYTEYLKNVSSMLGGGRSIFSTDKQTTAETNLSLNIDEMLVSSVYPQFNNFLDYNINRKTKKFKFTFTLSGSNSSTYIKNKIDQTIKMADKGVVCINDIANCLNKNIFELKRELEMTKAMGFSDMLLPMLNINTMSDKGGRPQSDVSDLSDSGINTRDTGNNLSRGGNI